jgi:hypothetical protein
MTRTRHWQLIAFKQLLSSLLSPSKRREGNRVESSVASSAHREPPIGRRVKCYDRHTHVDVVEMATSRRAAPPSTTDVLPRNGTRTLTTTGCRPMVVPPSAATSCICPGRCPGSIPAVRRLGPARERCQSSRAPASRRRGDDKHRIPSDRCPVARPRPSLHGANVQRRTHTWRVMIPTRPPLVR